MSEPYLIKKYANRRLYDTTTSSHITLKGIKELILAGKDVRIVDDTSGEDLTRTLLLQIIADQEQSDRPLLDTEFLMGIIRLYGNPMQDFMGEYLLKSFEAFMQQQHKLQEQMQKAMTVTPLNTMQDLLATQMKAWQAMQDALLRTPKDPSKDEE